MIVKRGYIKLGNSPYEITINQNLVHFWFNTGSRIIENNSGGVFPYLQPYAGGSNNADPCPIPFPNPAGQS